MREIDGTETEYLEAGSHEYATYELNGVEVCYTCDPTGENCAHTPTAAAWARGEGIATTCTGAVIPCPE